MRKAELHKRFDKLTEILSLSSGLGYFSPLQRTCLHQERSAIMQAINRINYADEEAVTPRYQIPAHLEQKVKKVINDFK